MDSIVTQSRTFLDSIEARVRERLACDSPSPDPGCNVTVRYIQTGSRGSPPVVPNDSSGRASLERTCHADRTRSTDRGSSGAWAAWPKTSSSTSEKLGSPAELSVSNWESRV